MSKPPGTWQQAVAWLEHQSKHPDKNYKDLCANLAARSFGFDFAGDNASPWGRTVPARYRVYGSHPPKGALVFWITNGWGHVAVSYGNGRVICNNASGGVSVQPISYYSGLGQPFWIRHVNLKKAIAFRPCGGANPGEWPYAVSVNQIVARPGKRSSYVPKLRKALGGSSRSTYYGLALKRRVIKWQRSVGDTTPNGNVRKRQFDRITK